MNERAEMYSRAVHEKTVALDNCVGFIDVTVLEISRSRESTEQLVMYNGHKWKHALKYQVVTTPHALIFDAAGPIEGRLYDWALYACSGLEEQLSELLVIGGDQYDIYGDAGYNLRSFMEIPFPGLNLLAAQRSFNKPMYVAKVTLQWLVKDVKLCWTTVDFKRKLCLSESPVGALYLAALLLTNLRACLYPKNIAKYFKWDPPTLDAYIEHKSS